MNRRLVSSRFPFVPLVLAFSGQVLRIEALLDTGFDGFVIVPAGALDAIADPGDRVSWRLSDGTFLAAKSVLGTATIVDLDFDVPVVISELGREALVGREVIDLLKLTLDHGRELIIEP
jgi:predicted aspartyl protease